MQAALEELLADCALTNRRTRQMRGSGRRGACNGQAPMADFHSGLLARGLGKSSLRLPPAAKRQVDRRHEAALQVRDYWNPPGIVPAPTDHQNRTLGGYSLSACRARLGGCSGRRYADRPRLPQQWSLGGNLTTLLSMGSTNRQHSLIFPISQP